MSLKEKKHITFVCTGNTCRSPMAECLFRHAVMQDPDFENFIISSAGVSTWEGSPASLYAIQALETCGLSLSRHRAKNISQELIDHSILVLCMTHSHKDILELSFNTEETNIHLLREFMENHHSLNIPDPFGRSLEAYESCRDSIVEAIPSVIKYIKENLLL